RSGNAAYMLLLNSASRSLKISYHSRKVRRLVCLLLIIEIGHFASLGKSSHFTASPLQPCLANCACPVVSHLSSPFSPSHGFLPAVRIFRTLVTCPSTTRITVRRPWRPCSG